MMGRNKSLILLLGVAFSTLISYGESNVRFVDPQSYKSIEIYDSWKDSPFNSGALKGNFGIVENPDLSVNEITGEPYNDSSEVVGVQRSRFGSNLFGLKVDLASPFDLSSKEKYVHVKLLKPQKGRTMLIGLGSRKERLGQNPFTEQFWVISSNTVEPGQWVDAVFPIKGADGIEIRSLVVVPDCESPHELESDFLFYVGDIEINDVSKPGISNEYYPIAGDKEESLIGRNDRGVKSLSLRSDNGVQQIKTDKKYSDRLYQDLLDETFYAKPGETLTPGLQLNGSGLHAYCYIDLNNDGKFSINLDQNDATAELVSYNFYNGKNSEGESIDSQTLKNSKVVMPSFTLPSDLEPGMYRMRFKVDSNSIDPKGNTELGEYIADNGGMIADVMLCVYGDFVEINDFQLNGEVLAADNTKLNSLKAPSDKDFAIRSLPEKGFFNGGIVIKQGYNLDNEEITDQYGNPQYRIYSISPDEFDEENLYVIPGDIMRGNILINGVMLEEEDAGIGIITEEAYSENVFYDLKGLKTNNPGSGIYIRSGKKIFLP